MLKNSVVWLRISFWVGAAADAVAAAVMCGQAVFARTSPLTHYLPEVPYRYAMGLAGSLMIGWTLLLLWADRKPLERRGVLIITIIVVLGLMGTGLFAVSTGFMATAVAAPLLLFQALLIVLFASSYLASLRNGREIKGKGVDCKPQRIEYL